VDIKNTIKKNQVLSYIDTDNDTAIIQLCESFRKSEEALVGKKAEMKKNFQATVDE
jgi:hypothetical protein